MAMCPPGIADDASVRRMSSRVLTDKPSILHGCSLAVTTTYLRRLEGEADRSWAQVAAAIGLG